MSEHQQFQDQVPPPLPPYPNFSPAAYWSQMMAAAQSGGGANVAVGHPTGGGDIMTDPTSDSVQTTVKLASAAGADKRTYSKLMVKTSVQRTGEDGVLLTVGAWLRDFVEGQPEFLVKIVKRNNEVCDKGKGPLLLLFGDGCETLVLLEDVKAPKNLDRIPRVGVAICVAPIEDGNDMNRLSECGVSQPEDSMFCHVRDSKAEASPGGVRVYIHTDIASWPRNNNPDKGQHVLRVWTRNGFAVDRLERIDKPVPRRRSSLPPPPAAAASSAAAATPAAAMVPAAAPFVLPATSSRNVSEHSNGPSAAGEEPTRKRWFRKEPLPDSLGFNPKQVVLLEKAYTDRLNADDMKMDDRRYSRTDWKNATRVMQRVTREFEEEEAGGKPRHVLLDGSFAGGVNEAKPPAKRRKSSIIVKGKGKDKKEAAVPTNRRASQSSKGKASPKKASAGKQAEGAKKPATKRMSQINKAAGSDGKESKRRPSSRRSSVRKEG